MFGAMLRTLHSAARHGVLLALLLLTALLATACGDGDDGTLSKREYIARSNALQQEASSVFRALGGRVATTPAEAARYLAALDRLDAGLARLTPPATWRDEHATMRRALQTMRQSMAIVSKASPRNKRVIELQLERSLAAQRDYERAVRAINATR